MRCHELYLQKWLYSRFFVSQGYPVPCVFSTPMDAFSSFAQLWASENNPFAYLLDAKDAEGTPLYEPYPSPVRYPLISVMRKGIAFRPGQNFSIHRWHHINWPTISDEQPVPGTEQIGTDLKKCDLAHVTTSRMPMAFDYKFQIDHFCLRPDTQAFYVERLLNQFWRSGGKMQTWMDIEYPGWGSQYIRVYVDGAIDHSVPEDLQGKNVEFRTSFTVVIEGFSIDVAYQVEPAVWKFVFASASPGQLDRLSLPALTVDVRPGGVNAVLNSRPNVPLAGTCQQEILHAEWTQQGTVVLSAGDQRGIHAGDNVIGGGQQPVLAPPGAIFAQPTFSFGIPSTAVFGYGTVADAALEPPTTLDPPTDWVFTGQDQALASHVFTVLEGIGSIQLRAALYEGDPWTDGTWVNLPDTASIVALWSSDMLTVYGQLRWATGAGGSGIVSGWSTAQTTGINVAT